MNTSTETETDDNRNKNNQTSPKRLKKKKYLESLYEYFKTILEVILMISDQEVMTAWYKMHAL